MEKEPKTAQEMMLEPEKLNGDSDKTIRETASEEAMRMMFEEEGIEMRTDLSPPMILAMARGDIFVDIFKSKVMKNFINKIQVLSVSKNRKSRGELVALVRSSQDIIEEPSDLSSVAKLFGKTN